MSKLIKYFAKDGDSDLDNLFGPDTDDNTDPGGSASLDSDSDELDSFEDWDNDPDNEPDELDEAASTDDDPEPKGDEADSEAKPEDPVLKELREQNARLTAMLEKVVGKKEEKEPEPEPEVDIYEDPSFKKLTDILELDPAETEVFKIFLKKNEAAVEARTINKLNEILPGLIGEQVTQRTSVQSVETKFFTDHAQLKPVKNYVSQVAKRIHSEQPGIGVEKILELAAKETYSALGIKKVANKPKGEPDKQKKKPAFPNAPSRRKGAPQKPVKKEQVHKEILDLLNL